MGYANDILIPAAVLWRNPGITREDFIELLNQVHYFGREIRRHSRWDVRMVRDNIPWDGYYTFNRGLHGLANILNLNHSVDFANFTSDSIQKDEFGIEYGHFHLNVRSHKEKGDWKPPKYEVSTQLPSKLSDETEFGRFIFPGKLQKGDVVEDDGHTQHLSWDYALVERYVTSRKLKEDWLDEDAREHVMLVRPILLQSRVEKFEDLSSLTEKHPHFHPDFMFDWQQDSGIISFMRTKDYLWIKKGDRYYLDDETFRRISAKGGPTEEGYTALVSTAEAIRNKAWKLLSYRGLQHTSSFLRRFPDSAEALERAIWDSHTSLYAKQKSMTYGELLRMRLLREK